MTDTPALALTQLGHERLLTFNGKEARKFLQGQLTCDVEKLEHGHYALGACCSPKGRMVANFRIFAIGESMTLTLPDNQISALHDHLKKYAMFFRTVSIEDTSEQWIRIGLSGTEASAKITSVTGKPAPKETEVSDWEHGVVHSLPGNTPRFEFWIKPESEQVVLELLEQGSQPSSIQNWLLDDIQNGIAWITEQTRETYIPQHLNWQALEGISFTKGCYTGQEIVARMKYLGKLKSHLYLFSLKDNNQVPEPGTVVKNASDKKSGEVVTALTDKNDIAVLAVVRSEDLENGNMTLADSGATLNLQSLPYEV